MTKRAPRNAERILDRAIISQIDAFGFTVAEAVARLDVLVGRPSSHADRELARLEATGVLSTGELYPGRTYYFRPAPDERFGMSSSATAATSDSFSRQSKIRRFAMLSFCCLGNVVRKPLTSYEMQPYAATEQANAPHGPYYTQTADAPTFGFLRVDVVGDGRWDRILAKCIEDVRRHARMRLWQPFIAAGRFEVTLATALPQKVERLCRAFRDTSPQPVAPIRITAIPELLNLIAPPPETPM